VLISFGVAKFIFDGLVQIGAYFAGSKENYPVVSNSNEGIRTGAVFFNMGINGLRVQIVGTLNIGVFGI
jgi:hypothetical protein